jgi:hypothetical protein
MNKKSIKPVVIAVVAVIAAIAGYYGIDIPTEIQVPAVDAACVLSGAC